MIAVNRLKGGTMYINAEMIELVEAVPDTTITLQNGHKYIVADEIEQVIRRVVDYRRALACPASLEETV